MKGDTGNTTHEGWKNRATWNVALWISNDEPLYRAAVEFMRTYKGRRPYSAFIEHAGLVNARTPDRFSFSGRDLDRGELNEMMREFTGS